MALGPKTVPPIPRHELIATALELGISRPETLTEAELTHCIQQVSEGRSEPPPHSRGWISVARSLVASVVEQGLNLPSAARVLRDGVRYVPHSERPPLPTVTLARIYLAQGHADRARATLEQVLARNPHHSAARSLLSELDTEPLDEPEPVAPASEPVAPASEPVATAPVAAPGPVAPASEPVATAPVAAPEPVAPASDPAASAPEPVATAPVAVPVAVPEPIAIAPSSAAEPEPLAAEGSPQPLPAEPTPRPSAAPPTESPTAVPPTADWLVVLSAADELIIYWELGDRGQRARERGLPLCIRTLSCVPSPRGAETREEEHVVSDVSGWINLKKEPEVVVRAALGIQAAASADDATALAPGWVPLCVASSHRVVAGSDRLHVDYRPRKQQHDADVAARARKYAMRA